MATARARLSGGDAISDLVYSEVAISGTTALTATAFGKMHDVAAAASAYTITLPAVSGNGGKLIGFRFDTGNSYIVTIDGSGAETINGNTTRAYVANESCILLCDGIGWYVVSETMEKVSFSVSKDNAQSMTSGVNSKIEYDDEIWDTHGCYDNVTNYRFTPTAAGIYDMTATASIASLGAGKQFWVGLRKNGGSTLWGAVQLISATGSLCGVANARYSMNGTTDYVEGIVYHDHGSARNTVAAENYNRFSGDRVDRETS